MEYLKIEDVRDFKLGKIGITVKRQDVNDFMFFLYDAGVKVVQQESHDEFDNQFGCVKTNEKQLYKYLGEFKPSMLVFKIDGERLFFGDVVSFTNGSIEVKEYCRESLFGDRFMVVSVDLSEEIVD